MEYWSGGAETITPTLQYSDTPIPVPPVAFAAENPYNPHCPRRNLEGAA
jgi:hypothetical protein